MDRPVRADRAQPLVKDSFSRQGAFKRGHAEDWTAERLAQLSSQELKQLRENAERLNEPGVVALCSEALKARPRTRSTTGAKPGPRR